MRGSLTALTGLLLCPAVLTRAQETASSRDTMALVEKGRAQALVYTQALPDYICTEEILRYQENVRQALSSFRAVPLEDGKEWVPIDKLTVKLSYFQKKEDHTLVLVDGSPTTLKYESLDLGATGTGEFGGILQMIFDPPSQTSFRWDRWKNSDRGRTAVYTYRVPVAHSQFFIQHAHKAIVGLHGSLELDPDSGAILRFTQIADRIPKELGLDSSSTTVEFDFADVGGRRCLLPSRSETEMHSADLTAKNKILFRDYRKFEASSAISYGGK